MYAWAANKVKLERAIRILGPEAPEESVKEKYIEFGGKVLNKPGKNKHASKASDLDTK